MDPIREIKWQWLTDIALLTATVVDLIAPDHANYMFLKAHEITLYNKKK